MALYASKKPWPDMAKDKNSFIYKIMKHYDYGPYGLALLKWNGCGEDDVFEINKYFIIFYLFLFITKYYKT